VSKAKSSRRNGCFGGRPKGSKNKPKMFTQYSLDQAIRADSVMTFNEIARQMGIAQSTAQFLYESGMTKLKRLSRTHFSEFKKAVADRRAILDRQDSMKMEAI
jgi:DNA-binding CsgD family transcriptional regulator